MTTQALEFTREIDATPAEAFRAWTRSMALREWLCGAASPRRWPCWPA